MAKATYSLPRIKMIGSYTGLSRWLSETSDAVAWLARCQVEDIPSPYRYSPSIPIMRWKGKMVVWFETAHRHYEVFEVPASLLRFKSDFEATEWHVRCRKSA